ncbi:MAG: hypothetical protein A2X64_07865 [Ignavibacteria bacterium GWF2_33_9]|nr:MAG: hypothetical protein A2X64_07865 [Ignavibacteria bacterium GWF2_33_9]
MKTKLLIIFLLLNTSIVIAQLTPQWSRYDGGLKILQDSTSDKENYLFNSISVYQSPYYFPLYWNQFNLGMYNNVDPTLFQMDSNTFARVVVEQIQSFPKNGIYYGQWEDVGNYHHIEISKDRCKSWQRIFSLRDKTDEIFLNLPTDSLGATILYFLNDSTILISGIFKEINYRNTPYIAKLTRGSNPDSLWNFRMIKYWRRTTVLPPDIKMINDQIGYAQYLNIFGKGFEILKTYDCWKSYTKIYPLDTDPNPINGFNQLSISADSKDTLIVFYDNVEDMIYYTKDEFKTKYAIDFTIKEPVYRLFPLSPQILYVLNQISKTDQNYKEYYIYRLLKTTNYGHSWEKILETPRGDSVLGFRIYDENHITVSGIFHPENSYTNRAFMHTSNGGQTWEYLYEFGFSYRKNFITSYNYINKDQIIFVGSYINPEPPDFDKDLSYFNQIKSFNRGNGNVSYYVMENRKTLIPPELKIDEVLYNVHKFDKDVLFWNKVQGATEYRIRYYGVANTTLDNSNNFLLPSDFTTLRTQQIDTVVADTFLTVYNLKRNFNYFFIGTSLNDTLQSENSILQTTSLEYPELYVPRLYNPFDNIENPYQLDTLPPGEVIFRWKRVPNAVYYNIVLFESKNYYSNYLNTNTRFIFNTRNYYMDTTLTYKELKPNTYYTIFVTAQNQDEVSNYSISRFVTTDGVAIKDIQYETGLILFPNPATDFITFDAHNLVPMSEIVIYDVFGNMVLATTPSRLHRDSPPKERNFVRIDVSVLPAGVYFVRIGNEVRKFVKMM